MARVSSCLFGVRGLAVVSALAATVGRTGPAGSARTSTSQAHQRVTPRPPTRVLVSRGFLVYNLSSHPIRLAFVDGDGNFEGRPEDGSILQAKSAYHRFEVQVRYATVQRDTAHYAIIDDQGVQIGTFEVHMEVGSDVFGPIDQTASCQTSIGTCDISPALDVITLFDPAAGRKRHRAPLRSRLARDWSAGCQVEALAAGIICERREPRLTAQTAPR